MTGHTFTNAEYRVLPRQELGAKHGLSGAVDARKECQDKVRMKGRITRRVVRNLFVPTAVTRRPW